MNLGGIAEFAPAFANTCTTGTELNTLGIQKCFIESGEVNPLTTVFLVRDLSAGSSKVGLGDITQVFHLGEQLGARKHLYWCGCSKHIH